MLIRHICYALVAFIGGAAISSGYFAFISLIGVFPKLAEKSKGRQALYADRMSSGIWRDAWKYYLSVQYQDSAFHSRSCICHAVWRNIYRVSGGCACRGSECIPDYIKTIFCQTVYSIYYICSRSRKNDRFRHWLDINRTCMTDGMKIMF